MNDDLIEKIARAIARADGDSDDNWEHWLIDASAALSAIEKSGTHVVVPKEPAPAMRVGGIAAINGSDRLPSDVRARAVYDAMLSARPPIGGETNE